MPCWFLTTARPSMRMTLKWARLGTSCAASLRVAGRNFIRENRPICEARKVGVTLWRLLQLPDKNLPFSPADGCPGWTQVRQCWFFDSALGSTHILLFLIPFHLSSSCSSNKRWRDEVLLDGKPKKKEFSCFFPQIKMERGKEVLPPLPASSPPCTCLSLLGLLNNSNSSSECVKPRNTLYCVRTRSDGQ